MYMDTISDILNREIRIKGWLRVYRGGSIVLMVENGKTNP